MIRVLCLLLLSLPAWGATYYVRPGFDSQRAALTYGTGTGASYENAWAGCAAVTGLTGGDVLEIDDAVVWYERCELTASGTSDASRLTVRGRAGNVAEFQHTVPINGQQSFTAVSTWSATSGYTWSQVSGSSVWKKLMNTFIYQMTESGTPLTGDSCFSDDEATAVARLSPGEFCVRDTNPDTLYYRPTSGVPSSYDLRVSAQNDAASAGLVYLNGSQFVNLSNLRLKYHNINVATRPATGALALLSVDNVTATDISATLSIDGISIDSGTNIIVDDFDASYNTNSGVTVEGQTDSATTGVNNLVIHDGTCDYNGRQYTYDTSNGYRTTSDNDCIGIGFLGGFGIGIVVESVMMRFNGSPDGDADAGGGGVIVSTVDANDGFDVSVRRCWIEGSHGNAFNGDDWRGGDITGNIFINNCRGGCSSTAQPVTLRNTHANFTRLVFANNVLMSNYGAQGLYLFNTTVGNAVSIQNNAFIGTLGTWGAGTFNAELNIGVANDNVTEASNVVRTLTASKAIRRAATTYTSAQIDDGTWNAVSALLGAGTVTTDPQFLGGTSPTTVEGFCPSSASPLVAAGTPTAAKYDYRGRRFNTPPSIGACERDGRSTVPFLEPR
jgi:hypothetical protein